MNILILNETGLFDWFVTLVPIIFSGVIIWFTSQQVKIAKMKRKDDLYDKRYKVYEKLRDFALSVIYDRGKINKQKELLKQAMFHEFLFEDDLNKFLKSIWEKHHQDIAALFMSGYAYIEQDCVKYIDSCPEEKRNKYNEAYYYFMDNFLKNLREKFEPYLNLQKIK